MKKLLLVSLAAVAAVAAVSASTAIAGGKATSASSLSCSSVKLFSPAASFASAAKSKIPREPVLRLGQGNQDIPTGNSQTPSPTFRAEIPVYFHVITPTSAPDAPGNVTDAQVAGQIMTLNLAFAGFYDSIGVKTDTGFRFTLAGTTRTTNAVWWAAQPGTPDEFAMKGALRQGGQTALNIYSTSGGGFLGWAYFPKFTTTHQKYEVLDGVVQHWASYIKGGPLAPAFDLGFTAVHEAGHWLGLYHVFDPEPFGCRGDGDRVDDTPAMSVPTGGCPPDNTKDTCPEPGFDPIHNFMDYSNDPCYFEFTQGQAARMQAHYSHWRLKHP